MVVQSLLKSLLLLKAMGSVVPQTAPAPCLVLPLAEPIQVLSYWRTAMTFSDPLANGVGLHCSEASGTSGTREGQGCTDRSWEGLGGVVLATGNLEFLSAVASDTT